jgi:hypothetical protein
MQITHIFQINCLPSSVQIVKYSGGMGEFEPSARNNALHQNRDGSVGQVADAEEWNVCTER